MTDKDRKVKKIEETAPPQRDGKTISRDGGDITPPSAPSGRVVMEFKQYLEFEIEGDSAMDRDNSERKPQPRPTEDQKPEPPPGREIREGFDPSRKK